MFHNHHSKKINDFLVNDSQNELIHLKSYSELEKILEFSDEEKENINRAETLNKKITIEEYYSFFGLSYYHLSEYSLNYIKPSSFSNPSKPTILNQYERRLRKIITSIELLSTDFLKIRVPFYLKEIASQRINDLKYDLLKQYTYLYYNPENNNFKSGLKYLHSKGKSKYRNIFDKIKSLKVDFIKIYHFVFNSSFILSHLSDEFKYHRELTLCYNQARKKLDNQKLFIISQILYNYLELKKRQDKN